MNNIFFTSFWAIFQPVFKIAIIAFLAGFLVRKKVVTQEQVDGLSSFTIYVLLPCLIFSKTIAVFNPESLPFWWLLPLTGMAMILGGVAVTWLLFFKELPEKNKEEQSHRVIVVFFNGGVVG